MNAFCKHIEVLIFCAKEPLSVAEIKNCLQELFDSNISDEDILNAINELKEKYEHEDFTFGILESGAGYRFMTKPAFYHTVQVILKQNSKKKLSQSALETLSIIAYKQPVSKAEIEKIRGVNSDYSIQRLLEKELIEMQGKSDAIGRPLIYGTSKKFMDYFGINDLNQLPQLKDLPSEEMDNKEFLNSNAQIAQ